MVGQGMSERSPTSAGAFLERDEGLLALEGSLTEIVGGSGGKLLLVTGEAGGGKTVLLRRFSSSQPASIRVLWGSCEPLLTPRPLGPLFDVAETVGGEFEELVRTGARPHEVTAALLGELDKRPPTLLVLEDLHWADEATLDVFRLLARRIESVATLAVASFRDDELDRAPQLRIVLGELPGRPRRLKLASLSLDAVRELAAPHGVDGHELHEKTGGNPFFVTEVLGAPSERIPETVRDAVLARAERLPEPARRLLQALAVVPGRVELWLLSALAGEPADRLEQCLASGVLTVVDGGVAYRHELAREAVETTLPPDRRLALHRAALTALSAPAVGDPDPTRLSHHAEAVGDAEAVLMWAPQAAVRAAGAGAHREAAAQYARALRFSDRLTAEARADLLERRAYECFLVNESTETIASLQQAIELSRSLDDRLRVGRLLCSLARALHESGRDSEGTALVREAVELLEPLGESRELGRAFGTRAQFCMLRDDLEQAVTWGDKAIELAERHDDTETLVHALNTVGTALLNVGSRQGAERLERSLRLARSAGLDVDVGRAFNNLVAGALVSRDYGLAERYVGVGIEYCEDAGLELWRELLSANRLRLELDRGRWERAGEAANALLSDARCTVSVRSEALVSLGLVRARRGDPEIWAPLDEALALTASSEVTQAFAPVAVARAEAAWLEGKSTEVAGITDNAFAMTLARDTPWITGELAVWRWRAGIWDALSPGKAAEPFALSIAGEGARAASLWQEIGCPYEAALAMADSGNEKALREALDQLQALGARPAAAIVARRLRKLGVRGLARGPRSRTRQNPAGLTARELEVLALLAEGLRNAQIAERLVVSEKTVDHHVSAILAKLDVRTRGEASAQATRLGLTAPT
jgi:DNA-binding CsgD family transcriptional regulator/tetratricopeptide (TPR) repeat protein